MNNRIQKITPKITVLQPKKLVGLSITMSLTNNLTGQLWQQFGPLIKQVPNRLTSDKISMQMYPSNYYTAFSPTNEFEKWATVEVDSFDNIPKELNAFELTGGLYAVFAYKGSSDDPTIFQYIFSEWLPQSTYAIDDRPHFEVLGQNYRNNDPNSEEEIWIPIKEKQM